MIMLQLASSYTTSIGEQMIWPSVYCLVTREVLDLAIAEDAGACGLPFIYLEGGPTEVLVLVRWLGASALVADLLPLWLGESHSRNSSFTRLLLTLIQLHDNSSNSVLRGQL